MKINRNIAWAYLLFVPFSAAAQTAEPALANSNILVKNLTVMHKDGSLLVDMDFNMDKLEMRANQRIVLTPVVKSGSQTCALPSLVVNGRKQHISYDRAGHRKYPEGTKDVRRKNKTAQTFHYSARVEHREWMNNANVVVAEDLCGCGGKIENQDQTLVQRMRKPYMAYLRPEAEGDFKPRHVEGSAFIDFPVDQITLTPDYRQNPRELEKIINTINVVKNDPNTSITSVIIHGFASPESPYEHNAYLAENRAKTLKNYVSQLVEVPDSKFTVKWTPENWDGLKQWVEASNLTHRSEILAIMDHPDFAPDAREWKIKSTYPDDYKVMLTSCYPALRRSDYVVNYAVRAFTVDEAKALIKTKPQQLSLEEMFLVAQTYEPGSAEFNEVFEIAVRMFPDDPTANLNAACARIETGDYAAAEKYLQKAGDTPYAHHARGVLAMRSGHDAEAKRYFEAAAKGGVKEAAENLRILQIDAE